MTGRKIFSSLAGVPESCRAALRRRWIACIGAILLPLIFLAGTVWIVPGLEHSGWVYTEDIWNNFQLAHFLDIGIYQTIYGQGTLATTPGIVVLLAPLAAITHATGMSVVFLYYVPHPTAWLLLAPYEGLISAPALFAVDSVAARLGASTFRRLLICACEVLVLYNVLWWGHPEDAIAVAFLLYSCLAASDKRWARAGWLLGGAVAFQPFVLLALPVVLFPAGVRWLPGLAARVVAPTAALLFLPLTLDWSVTISDLLHQPASPGGGRPTPWLGVAPVLYRPQHAMPIVSDGLVGLIALALGLLVGLWFARAERELSTLVAVVAVTLTFWCDFDVAIAPYYIWPPIAAALASVGVARWPRFVIVILLVSAVDWVSNFQRHSEWLWWPIIGGLAVLVAASWPLSARQHLDEMEAS